jgi:hypothetical protein
MHDFEKLGVFYLGKTHDLTGEGIEENLVLYKSKDLTTHAVIIGMTGSGKTGLGIGLLEEAAIDNIPVLVIDPKGDMGNMALAFPELKPEDFEPWVNPHEASNKGMTVKDYAKAQAKLWRDGLNSWGQGPDRIKMYKDAVDITVYTPGSSAGVGVSLLKSFDAPPIEIVNDRDAFSDKVSATATSILSLVGIDADPITSQEHILISNILDNYWKQNKNLSIEDLIGAIQNPPMDKIGVLSLDNFYPAKDRFSLAMRLNGLLASPSFNSWLEGEPMDINRFLYTAEGKPRVSIFSIAHLPDTERMFFVSMFLNEIIAWMRTQPGTGSLRAILYMDEMFGFLPPTANPPSKTPFMTLLKQARAYGLGLALSTQNPVDLDYKALSNTGTWFIGRLQTERDKNRVIAGLEGAAAGGNFDKRRTEQILAGLSQRMFYLHNVHSEEAMIFQTRWVMSYLAGPLTRDQIASLPQQERTHIKVDITPKMPRFEEIKEQDIDPVEDKVTTKPILPSQIKQVFLPVTKRPSGELLYVPKVIGVADVRYTNANYGVNHQERMMFVTPLNKGPVVLDWTQANQIDLSLEDLDTDPIDGVTFAGYPSEAANFRSYDKWTSAFRGYLRSDNPLTLLYSPTLKVVSNPGEDEREFRIRISHLAHEQRDQAMEDLRRKYGSKISTLEDRRRRAQQTLERQSSQARQRKVDAAVSTGVAILGTLFGSRSINQTSVSRVGTAMRSANRAMQSGDNLPMAEENIRALDIQIKDLELELQKEIDKLIANYDIHSESLDEVTVRPTYANITIHFVGLSWMPYIKDGFGNLSAL